MRVVIVGSGKLGCGYLVPLFLGAGHEVLLGCRTPDTAHRIRSAGGWRVRVTGEPPEEVHGVATAAVSTTELDEAVAAADLVVLCVGVANTAGAAPHLVPGLAARRGRPVDVWVVENAECAPWVGEALVDTASARGVQLPPVGVAGAVAGVTVGRGSWHEAGVPEFIGDGARRLVVDTRPLRLAPPALPGVQTTGQYRARLREKLFVHNAGHALAAYLGWLRGHRTIDTAIGDPFVRPIVAGALLEARRAILAAYPGLLQGRSMDHGSDVHGPVADALARYGNTELADPVTRVAREPLRKLAPGDRLLGPVALLRRTSHRVPAHFALGIAAALLYGYGDEAVPTADASARRLRRLLDERGVFAVLTSVCGLAADDPFAAAVAARYHGFVFTDDGVRFPPAAPATGLEAPLPHAPSDRGDDWRERLPGQVVR
ncbi:2-dehydropantoate 2-reductase N-terminal domain-containing protein [Streptomyces flaveus]|uniref:mannitol dehydrogenase family protein n=1 Tax=Streptomyces flaveus TaxID=66370 RepID=UPI00332CA921